jgi:hypothetical protein
LKIPPALLIGADYEARQIGILEYKRYVRSNRSNRGDNFPWPTSGEDLHYLAEDEFEV